MFCEFCGKEIDGNSGFCEHCGRPVRGGSEAPGQPRFMMGQMLRMKSDPSPASQVPAASGNQVKGSPGTVLSEGEVIVRSYNCANIKGVAGYLTVTNKRMMFNASGSADNSRYSQEVPISSVSGFTLHKGTNYNWTQLVVGALLAIIGLISMVSSISESNAFVESAGILPGLVLMAVGGLLIFLGRRLTFRLIVYAKDVIPSPIHIGEGPKSIMGNAALYAIACTPTSDTDLMISELGALVQDIQSMGDSAIGKWRS